MANEARPNSAVEKEKMMPSESDLPKLAAPAGRALAAAGITRLEQLSRIRASELAQLHGIGPHALQTLRKALEEKGLAFLPEKSSSGSG